MTDDNDDTSLEAMIEKEQVQREGVNAHIEKMNETFLRNDSWQTFKADEIAEASLEVAVANTGSSSGDDQTRRFLQFISIATNFSSLPFAEKLLKVPELIESIKQLLEDMMKEVKEYSDMANELRDLIHCFVRMVMQVKHNVNMMLPLLNAATRQMTIVQDVMSTEPSQVLNEIDKRDIDLALNRMSIGIQNLLDLAKSSTAESQKLDERIHNMTNTVQSKKMVVEERLDIAKFCFKYAMPAGATLSGGVVGGLVAAEAFGGTGALVIAGTAFPPVAAIVGATMLGGIGAATVINLVKKFWAHRQMKALVFLNQIFEGLVQLNSANMKFMRYMADAEEKANTVSQHMQDIRLCLESERQRRANLNVCNVAIESTTAMVESLKKISHIDISKWTDTPNTISFSTTNMITMAITN
jgi:hypothetical protein